MTISTDDIRRAHERIAPSIVRTTLSAVTGVQLFLKRENQQYTASFKERGALPAATALTTSSSHFIRKTEAST